MFRPVHFEIHATDTDAVRAFYESVFGWRFQQWGDIPDGNILGMLQAEPPTN